MKKFIAFLLVFCFMLSTVTAFSASDGAMQEMTEQEFDGEIIVTHVDAEKTGEWKESSLMNCDGAPTAYAGPESEITFTPKGLNKGNYEIFYWVMLHPNNHTQNFTVNHNGKTSETFAYFKIDADEEIKSGWVSLGVFDFAGKGKENLYLKADYGNTRATAVKFVPTDKEALGKEIPVQEEPEKAQPGDATLSHSIDSNLSGHCYYVGGWDYSGTLTGPMTVAPYSLWIAGAGPEAYVEYRPEILADCNVRVSVYLLYWKQSQVNDIKYEVYHNGKVDEFHLDPTSITENSWVTLGTFDFGGNDEDYVRLECVKNDNENFNTRASTVAFEIMNDDATNYDDPGAVWQTRYVSPNKDSNSVYVSQTHLMAPMNKFTDMKEHWAHYDVEYMAFEGLVSGKAEDTFDPDANITRAEYITILDRAMGYELITGETYSDVPADAWYATYVATAKANGLLNGLPTDDGFKPEQPITREEMALFTYNAIKATNRNDEWVKTLPTDFSKFTDAAEISDYAKGALEYLVQTGIIKGMTDTTVAPKGNATRAQGAVILKRFMQSFVWAGPPADEEWVMTFNEEFLGDSLNYDVWQSDNYPYGNGISSTRGPDNVEVKDGNLYMITKKEQKADKEWTTAHIWVKPEVFRQAYGYFESRYKICAANGINNAFWLMTSPNMVADSTQNFEIDINEGHYPNEVCPTYHYYNTGEHKTYSLPYRATYDLSEDYHTYALEWNPDELIYYFDNKEIARYKNENATIALFPYLSSAVLSWAGSIAGEEADGSAQIVDYVRVWQRPGDVNDPCKTAINRPVMVAEFNGIKGVSIDQQIVDNTEYPGEIIIEPVTEGVWKESIAVQGHTGKGHLFCQAEGIRADFNLNGIKAGKYKVYFWRLPHESNKTQENIFLVKPDGTEELLGSVALIPLPGTTADPGWIEIGEAELDSKNILRLNYTSSISRVSGIKLVPVK